MWQVYDLFARSGPRVHTAKTADGARYRFTFPDVITPVKMTEACARVFIGNSAFRVVAPDGRTWDDHWSGEVPPETLAALEAAALADAAATTPEPAEPVTLPPGYAIVAADEIERWPLLRLANAMGGEFGRSATKDDMVAFLIAATHAAPVDAAQVIRGLKPIPLPGAPTVEAAPAPGDDADDETDDTVIEVSDGDDPVIG